MRFRTIALCLVVVTLATGASSWLVINGPADAQQADSFDGLRDRLTTFDAAFLELKPSSGGRGPAGLWWVVQADSDGRVAMDPPPGGSQRFVWQDNQLTTIRRGTIAHPAAHVETVSTPPQLRQVWEEVRSGFANSVVTHDPPSTLGYQGASPATRGNDWVMIQLPFPWAADYRIFVHYVVRNQWIGTIVVLDATTGEPVNGPFGKPFHVTGGDHQRWDVPLQAGAFGEQWISVPQGQEIWPLSSDEPLVGLQASSSLSAAAPPVPRESMRAYEACEIYDGHEHGSKLHQEHSNVEILGEVAIP